MRGAGRREARLKFEKTRCWQANSILAIHEVSHCFTLGEAPILPLLSAKVSDTLLKTNSKKVTSIDCASART